MKISPEQQLVLAKIRSASKQASLDVTYIIRSANRESTLATEESIAAVLVFVVLKNELFGRISRKVTDNLISLITQSFGAYDQNEVTEFLIEQKLILLRSRVG